MKEFEIGSDIVLSDDVHDVNCEEMAAKEIDPETDPLRVINTGSETQKQYWEKKASHGFVVGKKKKLREISEYLSFLTECSSKGITSVFSQR